MRSIVGICLLLGVALAQSPAGAQELQELRKELGIKQGEARLRPPVK